MKNLDDFDLNIQKIDDDDNNDSNGPGIEPQSLSNILSWTLVSLTLVSEGWSNGAATNTTEYKC